MSDYVPKLILYDGEPGHEHFEFVTIDDPTVHRGLPPYYEDHQILLSEGTRVPIGFRVSLASVVRALEEAGYALVKREGIDQIKAAIAKADAKGEGG